MFEQDYIMRLISEMVRVLLKMLFNIETDSPTSQLLKESEEKERLERLLGLIDEGKINEAENNIYEMTSDGNMESLEIALLFYSYLNERTDSFLNENDFSRMEVKTGLAEILSRYGLNSMAQLFLTDL